jgi:hypothetical protein
VQIKAFDRASKMIIMKNMLLKNFLTFLPIIFIVFVGCGPFQNVSYYDADGIYNNSEDLEKKVTEIKQGKYYQKYFKDFGFATPQYNLRDNSPNLQMGFNNDLDYFNFDYWNNVFPFWSPYNRFYYNRLYSFNRFSWPRYSRFMSFGFQSLFFRHPLDYGFNFYAFNPLGINYGVGDPFFQSWSWGLFPWRSPIPFGWVGYSNWNNWNAYSMRGNNFVSYNRGSGNIVDYTNRRNYSISSSDNRSSIGESDYNRGVNKRNLNNEGSRNQISNGRINNSMNGDGIENRPGINRNNLSRFNNFNNSSQNRSFNRNNYSNPSNNSFNRSNNYGGGRSMNQNRSFSGSRFSGASRSSGGGRSSGGRSSGGRGNQK